MVMDLIIEDLLDYATNEQASKSVNKALKEGGQDITDRFVKRMAEPAKGARRAMIVDLALSVTGSQLIGLVLPTVSSHLLVVSLPVADSVAQLNKEQRGLLYDSIRSHIVTLRGCKTGSKVIWLL
jgi:pumilio RNA-binding family